LQSKLTDGQTVGPASVKPVNDRVLKARKSDWVLVREYPSWPGINECQLKRPDIREQSSLSPSNNLLAKRGGVHIRSFESLEIDGMESQLAAEAV
jgi:hypothetical protein